MSVRFTFFRKEKTQNDWVNRVQLIRTIERVAAERMGEKRAFEFFREISTTANFTENSTTRNFTENSLKGTHGDGDCQFWEEVVRCARGIVEPEGVREFVRVMVKGRFENIPSL